jgi:hypothetical protein
MCIISPVALFHIMARSSQPPDIITDSATAKQKTYLNIKSIRELIIKFHIYQNRCGLKKSLLHHLFYYLQNNQRNQTLRHSNKLKLVY